MAYGIVSYGQYLLSCTGEAAVKFESLPDDVIVAKALSVLRSIFGDRAVPEVLYKHSMHFLL